jgi:hypothetical protein
LGKRGAKGSKRNVIGAVARRIASSLYWVMVKNEDLPYNGYDFYEFSTPGTPALSIGLSKRDASLLAEQGLETSGDVEEACTAGKLHSLKGFGKA